MAVCQRVDERRHDHQSLRTSFFLVCIGIAAIYCAANALILWWRQPGKDDAADDDETDSTDAEAEAEQAEENEHDDVADTADTDTADAKENHNPQH